MMYQVIYGAGLLANPITIKPYPLGTIPGKSVKITNQSQYELDVFIGGIQIDAIPPYSYTVMANNAELQVQINTQVQSPYSQPYQYVSYTAIDESVPYQTGSTWQPSSQNASTSDVTVTNTPLAVTVQNQTLDVTGSVNAAVTGNVGLTGALPAGTNNIGSVTASIPGGAGSGGAVEALTSSPVSLLGSGGTVKKVLVSVGNKSTTALPATAVFEILNGSTPIAYISIAGGIPAGDGTNPVWSQPFLIDVYPGVTNNGIEATCTNAGGASPVAYAYAVE